jgi:hypothetical protein
MRDEPKEDMDEKTIKEKIERKRSRRTKKTILKGKKRLLPDALGLKEYGFLLCT